MYSIEPKLFWIAFILSCFIECLSCLCFHAFTPIAGAQVLPI